MQVPTVTGAVARNWRTGDWEACYQVPGVWAPNLVCRNLWSSEVWTAGQALEDQIRYPLIRSTKERNGKSLMQLVTCGQSFVAKIIRTDTSAGLLLAGGGCGGGPRAIGDDPLTTFLDAGVGGLSAFLEFHVDAGLPGRGPVPLGMAGPIRPRPVGLSVGIPPVHQGRTRRQQKLVRFLAGHSKYDENGK